MWACKVWVLSWTRRRISREKAMQQWILAPLVATVLLPPFPASAEPSSPIDPARLSATAKVLASDAFQGRAPGTT